MIPQVGIFEKNNELKTRYQLKKSDSLYTKYKYDKPENYKILY